MKKYLKFNLILLSVIISGVLPAQKLEDRIILKSNDTIHCQVTYASVLNIIYTYKSGNSLTEGFVATNLVERIILAPSSTIDMSSIAGPTGIISAEDNQQPAAPQPSKKYTSKSSVYTTSPKEYLKYAKCIRKNNIAKAQNLARRGVNINARDAKGSTPLLLSLQMSNSVFTDFFLTHEADVKIYDNAGLGCLEYAIIYGKNKQQLVNTFLELGCDINHRSKDQITPFQFGVLFGCPEIPFLLLNNGADYNGMTSLGQNSIHICAIAGCDTVLNLLVQDGLEYDLADNNQNTPLMLALANNRQGVADRLLELGASIFVENIEHHTPVYYAILNKDTFLLDYLLDNGATFDIPVDGNPPIYVAAQQGNAYFVRRLLEKGAMNPMQCNIHDNCFMTAFIYFVSADLATGEEKTNAYANSLNIYKLAEEKYKQELNKIRAKNTARAGLESCLICLSVFSGVYVSPTGSMDYQAERRRYLKERISMCNKKIDEIQLKITQERGNQ